MLPPCKKHIMPPPLALTAQILSAFTTAAPLSGQDQDQDSPRAQRNFKPFLPLSNGHMVSSMLSACLRFLRLTPRCPPQAAIGSFSYKKDTINCFNITVDNEAVQLRVEAINPNVAKIYITDRNGKNFAMPSSVTLRDSTATNVTAYNHEFLITWVESYVLSVAGVDKLWLTNPNQQAFETAVGITHSTI